MKNTDTRNDFTKPWHGGLPETPCGFGSTMRATRKQRLELPKWIAKYNIKSISDIGAGDLNWISKMPLGGVQYQGYDLVPRHKDVEAFNIIEEVPPKTDLILCLWVLNHMTTPERNRALENMKASGSKYLAVTVRHFETDPAQPIEEFKLQAHKNDRLILVEL